MSEFLIIPMPRNGELIVSWQVFIGAIVLAIGLFISFRDSND